MRASNDARVWTRGYAVRGCISCRRKISSRHTHNQNRDADAQAQRTQANARRAVQKLDVDESGKDLDEAFKKVASPMPKARLLVNPTSQLFHQAPDANITSSTSSSVYFRSCAWSVTPCAPHAVHRRMDLIKERSVVLRPSRWLNAADAIRTPNFVRRPVSARQCRDACGHL